MSKPELTPQDWSRPELSIFRYPPNLALLGQQRRLLSYAARANLASYEKQKMTSQIFDRFRHKSLLSCSQILEGLPPDDQLVITLPTASPRPLSKWFADHFPGVLDETGTTPVIIHVVPRAAVEAVRVLPDRQTAIAIDVRNPDNPAELHALVVDLYEAGINVLPGSLDSDN